MEVNQPIIGLVDTRNDPVSHSLAVLLPVLAVLTVALLIIATLAVQEEDSEVDDVEVGNRDSPALSISLDDFAVITHHDGAFGAGTCTQDLVARKTGGQAVRPRLDPVPEVVDVA